MDKNTLLVFGLGTAGAYFVLGKLKAGDVVQCMGSPVIGVLMAGALSKILKIPLPTAAQGT